MDYLGQDLFLTGEYDSMSVDAILAEFKAQSAAETAGAAARPAERSRSTAQAKKSRGEHLSMPSKHRSKRDRQHGRAPKQERAREAFAYTEDASAPDDAPVSKEAAIPAAEELAAPAPAAEARPAPAPAAEA
ncbi:MAG: hypothetical protein IJH48_00985, partial [Oscillospiraceae bacterium]|nr:hypothetical protein [Oscillospiraceae bacterium]